MGTEYLKSIGIVNDVFSDDNIPQKYQLDSNMDTKYLKSIGIVDGVFSADNIPQEWKEQIKQVGVRKKDLKNEKLRVLL